MSGRHHSHSRSKSSHSAREKESSKEPKSKRSKHYTELRYDEESTTPPLPVKNNTSIEELMRQRDALKKKLDEFSKHKSIDLKKSESKSSESKSLSRKRYRIESDLRDKSEMQNENDNSEDEDNIIEKRRKQRKLLLEKLNIPNVPESYVETDTKKNNDDTVSNGSTPSTNVEKKQLNKETADMFADDDFITSSSKPIVKQDNSKNSTLNDNWDDPEGYYNITIGDIMCNNRYTIKAILGQGVFANVVKAQDNSRKSEVAIKIVRNNDLMYKTGLKELLMIKKLNDADPDNRHHCVKFLTHFMHKGHLCIVLESMCMDLRNVIKKYGKHHGLNMKAIMSYSRQLLMALRLLIKNGIVHGDIKPDNILVNENKNVLKLCDFGSTTMVDDTEPTPYLVSRFYRAPEIILGIPQKQGIDVWSAACTIYEIATGRIMFAGSSNNKMLKCFMDVKGKFAPKLIKKGVLKDQHFNYNYNFLLHKKDEVTGREKVVEMSNIQPTRDILKELNKYGKDASDEKKLSQLKDLLEKMLVLDPSLRYSATDGIRHSFVREELER